MYYCAVSECLTLCWLGLELSVVSEPPKSSDSLRTEPYKGSVFSLQEGKAVCSRCSMTDFLRAVWVAICPQRSILVTVTLCTYYFS